MTVQYYGNSYDGKASNKSFYYPVSYTFGGATAAMQAVVLVGGSDVLTDPKDGWGSGVFVAPNVVLSCAHVLNALGGDSFFKGSGNPATPGNANLAPFGAVTTLIRTGTAVGSNGASNNADDFSLGQTSGTSGAVVGLTGGTPKKQQPETKPNQSAQTPFLQMLTGAPFRKH